MVRIDRRPRRRFDPNSRRAVILEAMVAAFTAHPYAEVAISSIAAGACSSNALVYRYFVSKEDLYAEVVRMAITDLLTRQTEAPDTLPDGVPVRDCIRATIMVYLDRIATHPDAQAMSMRQPGGEPATVAGLRARTRCDYVKRLQDLLVPSTQAHHDYALQGYFGLIDTAALRWIGKGYLEEDWWAPIGAALGALEGALGDRAT